MADAGEMAEKLQKHMKEKEEKDTVTTKGLPSDWEKKLEQEKIQSEFDKKARQDEYIRKNEQRVEENRRKRGAALEAERKQAGIAASKQRKIDEQIQKKEEERKQRVFLSNTAARVKMNERIRRETIAKEQKAAKEAQEQKKNERARRLASEAETEKHVRDVDRAAYKERERIGKETIAHNLAMSRAKTSSERMMLRRNYETSVLTRDPTKTQTFSEQITGSMRKPTTADSIRAGIKSINVGNIGMNTAIDTMAGSLFGGAVAGLQRQAPVKEQKQMFTQESRTLSAAFRNKQIGKKNPINDVIGVSGTVRRQYVTDGHGRSGTRATLEYRRANRQYRSPERMARASTNQNWLSDVMGTQPQPVRHRKVRAADRGLTPLQRFNKMI